MISEFGSGVFLPPDATGVTVVTETGTLAGGVVSLAVKPSLPAALVVKITVAVFVPSFSAAGSETMVNVTPCAPSVPDEGVTVAHGLSVFAVNERDGVWP